MTATAEQLVLREAAISMRELHPISHPRHEMWDRMAHLLEAVALRPESWPDRINALAVARAYLAAVDRPDIDGRYFIGDQPPPIATS